MSLSKKIALNTGIQVAGKLLGTVLSLIAVGIMTRYLGEAGMGKYTVVFSFLQVFGIMMDFGLYIIMIKRIAVEDENTDSLINNIFTLRIVSGVIFLGSAPIIAWLLSFRFGFYTPEVIQAIAISTFFYLFISLNQLLGAVFHKHLKTKWIAIAEFGGKLALVGAVIGVVASDLGFLWIMATLVISAGVNFGIAFFASQRYYKIRLAWDTAVWKDVLREAWPIGVSIGFALLYFKGDAVILSFFTDEETLGQYGTPYKILEVLVTFPAMFTGLALPVLSAAWEQRDTQRFKKILQKSFDALSIFVMPMIFGTIALAAPMIDLIAGTGGFEQSDSILKILIIATGAIYLGTLFGYVVPAMDKQKQMMWVYLGIALTSLVGYFYAIPRWSIHGAAWVTVYSEIMVMIIALIIITRTAKIRLNFLVAVKSLVAAVLMYAFLTSEAYQVIHRTAVEPLQNVAQRFSSGDLYDALAAATEIGVGVLVGAGLYALLSILLRTVRISELKEFANLRRG